LNTGDRFVDSSLLVLVGPGSDHLCPALTAVLAAAITKIAVQRFPDGEANVSVPDAVGGRDVYIVQATGPPVDERLVELALTVDACRRAGAARVTAVVPYFGYARQDRAISGGALGARVVADVVSRGVHQVVVVDPHGGSLPAAFSVPAEVLTAVPAFAAELSGVIPANGVLVAPDLGAAPLADRYGAALGLPHAIVRKTRVSGSDVRVEEVVGDVTARCPIVVDDMISTGGTVVAALEAVRARGATGQAIVVATHGLFVGSAPERLAAAGIGLLFSTDTVAFRELAVPHHVVSIASLLAETIVRLHGR
jgi:ribose-phosphate pyrophosphokinase